MPYLQAKVSSRLLGPILLQAWCLYDITSDLHMSCRMINFSAVDVFSAGEYSSHAVVLKLDSQ